MNTSLVQADHPTYTIRCDNSINVQSCDVTVTLDVGLVSCSEDMLFEGIFVSVKCEAGLSVVEARKYRIWSSEKQFLAFIPYKLKTNKRAEGTCINIFSCRML